MRFTVRPALGQPRLHIRQSVRVCVLGVFVGQRRNVVHMCRFLRFWAPSRRTCRSRVEYAETRAAIFRNGHIMFELDTITFMSLSLDSHFTIIPLISHFHVILIPPAPRSHLIRLAFISLPSHSHPIRILLSSRFHFAFLSLLSLSSHSNLTIISLSSHHALLCFFFWGWFG
jgi:hypothetical protein